MYVLIQEYVDVRINFIIILKIKIKLKIKLKIKIKKIIIIIMSVDEMKSGGRHQTNRGPTNKQTLDESDATTHGTIAMSGGNGW